MAVAKQQYCYAYLLPATDAYPLSQALIVHYQERSQEFATGDKTGSLGDGSPPAGLRGRARWWSGGEVPSSRRQMLFSRYDGGTCTHVPVATPLFSVGEYAVFIALFNDVNRLLLNLVHINYCMSQKTNEPILSSIGAGAILMSSSEWDLSSTERIVRILMPKRGSLKTRGLIFILKRNLERGRSHIRKKRIFEKNGRLLSVRLLPAYGTQGNLGTQTSTWTWEGI